MGRDALRLATARQGEYLLDAEAGAARSGEEYLRQF